MPPFPKPEFDFRYDPDAEITNIRLCRDKKPGRAIPRKSAGKLLLGSWNIANLGDEKQIRSEEDIKVISEILSWFDLIATQEVKENLRDFEGVTRGLPTSHDAVLTDQAGNDERMVFIYDTSSVSRLELAGEVAIPPSSHRYIKLPTTQQKFRGFDRNPFVVAFKSGRVSSPSLTRICISEKTTHILETEECWNATQ